MTAEKIIKELGLQKHPEGGFFFETYRSEELFEKEQLPKRYGDSRCHSTAIYFLITSENFSAFHRIKTDEIFHYYAGSPATITQIDKAGKLTENIMGNDITNGERPQVIVKADNWQALKCKEDGFTLLGTTVAPGFDFADFEMAKKEKLLSSFPQHASIIENLARQ